MRTRRTKVKNEGRIRETFSLLSCKKAQSTKTGSPLFRVRGKQKGEKNFSNPVSQRGEAATAESDRIGVSAHGRTGENDVA
jgi:hypothetical protein